MDPHLEDFISYEAQYEPGQEGLLDINFSLTSPFSDNSNNQHMFPNFIPDMPSILASPFEFPQKEVFAQDSDVFIQTQQSVDKKKQKKGKELDLSKLYIPPALQGEIGSKLNIQSKKITKAEKSLSPENLSDGSKESKEQKKADQVIRNRMSAQISRDKKKVYLQQLEGENQYLKQERIFMVEKIQRLETAYVQILKENEVLKSNGGFICQNCGCTATEFKNTMENAMPVVQDESAISSPVLQRDGNKKGFFGFSYAFTTLLCLVFVMTGGTTTQPEGQNPTAINFTNIVRTLTTDNNNIEATPSVPESPVMPSHLDLTKTYEPHFSSFEMENWPIMDTIESKIEEFDAYHEKLFESHRQHNDSVIDLSNSFHNITDSSSASANRSDNSSEKNFLSKPAVKARNKTSTMFCPSGVEFFQSGIADSFEDERDHGFALFGSKSRNLNLNRSSKTLNLDTAEYIQLLVPRYSIGRLGVSGNSSKYDQTPVFGGEDENGLVEVWCKIFAVNGLSRAL